MPFLKGGRQAITRTSKYLNAGQTVLQENVKILTLNHLPSAKISVGMDEFMKFFLPPLQFKNPNVQMLTFKNISPRPFIRIFLKDKSEILMDCSFRTHNEIDEHLRKVLGKSVEALKQEKIDNQVVKNPANFGREFQRQCICEVYGQIPCSSQIGRASPWSDLIPTDPVISDEVRQADMELENSVN